MKTKITLLIFSVSLLLACTQSAEYCIKKANDFYDAENYEQAFEWSMKAAKQGDAEAQNQIGMMYHNGIGTTLNYEKAFEWLLKAAEQGYSTAQYNVALMYYYGKGTNKNPDKAFEWFTKALKQGNAEAERLLKLTNDDDTLAVANKSLNDIRFGNWTDADWSDNDYFRFLRKCFNDCCNGVENQYLQEYKPILHNQFFIYKAEPFLMGGLFIHLGFLNEPETLYETSVYSDVDEETETITGYHLRGFRKSEETTDFTKEQILELLKEHPEYKLW